MAEMYNEQRVLGVKNVAGGDPQAVTGPLTNAQLTAVTGTTATAAYTDATGAAAGTVIGLLKGIYVQLAAINAKTPAP